MLCLFLLSGATLAETWHTNWESAAKESKKTGKPILIDFTGSDWCGWCIKLHDEVFSKPEFKTWAAENVVLLELDFPRKKKQSAAVKKANTELAQKYNVEGFPTVVFAQADGKELGRFGYAKGGPTVWTKEAETKFLRKRPGR